MNKPSPIPSYRSLGLRVVVALGLLSLAIWSNRVQIREVLGRSLDPRALALAIVLYLAGIVIAYVRWYLLVRAVGVPMRFRDALRLGLIGAMFNFVLPGAIAGVFIRAAFLCREHPDRKPQAIASAFADLLLGLIGLASLACVAGTWNWAALDGKIRRLVIAAYLLAAVFVGLLLLAFSPALARPSHTRKRFGRLLLELNATGAAYGRKLWIVVLGAVLGAVTHGMSVVAFYAIGKAMFPVVPSLSDHFLIVPLVLFSTGFPLPFGALGVSEQISAELFKLAAYAGGGVAMMGFRVLQITGALLGTCVYLANLNQNRALRSEAERLAEEEDFETVEDHPSPSAVSADAPAATLPCD